MFKNYLTYNFVIGFNRLCHELEAPVVVKERLLRSSECMTHHFARSVRTRDGVEEAKWLFVALTCLRDCKEILDEAKIDSEELYGKWSILSQRLEQLCWNAAGAEQGQLRMLG